MQNKKSAFSLVEIIIAIAIIILLAVIWLSANQGYKDKTDNTKIVSDIETINNALESYAQDNSSLPMPWGNTNFFKVDSSYSHSYDDTLTFWVYGSITEDTLPKKYLDVLPLDPRTNSYYSYWKTKWTEKIVANQFELASVQLIDWEYQAKVSWNYTAEAWPYNLIREYNGSNFVYDKSKSNLPYNPEELILIATADWVVYRENDTIKATSWDLEIFFSDGSVSVLEDWWELTLDKLSFPNKNNLNTFVKLSLWAWTIWTKATHLNDSSNFEVYTTDSTAAVRGTIFWVSKDSPTAPTEVFVVEWKVEVYKNDEDKTNIIDLYKDNSVRVLDWQREGTATLQKSDFDNIDENFIAWEDIRDAETVAMIYKEIEESANGSNNDETPVPAENQCPTYDNNWFSSNWPQDIWTFTLSKTVTTTDWNWTVTYNRNLTCNYPDYTENSDTIIATICDSWFTASNDWLNCLCSTFNINWVCQSSENTLWTPWNLVAYAPYNTSVTSASMIDDMFLKMRNVDDNINAYSNFKNWVFDWFPFTSIYKDVSLNNYWVKVDNDNHDDFIKYSNLNLNSDFIIEMRVKVPTDTDKHYLIHSSSDIRFFIQSWILYFNSTSFFPWLNISSWYQKVFLIKEWNNVFVAVWDLSSKTSTNQTLNNDINFMYVWAFEYWVNDYRLQINDIIDYIKIYKN